LERLRQWRPEAPAQSLPLLAVAHRAAAVVERPVAELLVEHPVDLELAHQGELPAGARDPELAQGQGQAVAHRAAARQR